MGWGGEAGVGGLGKVTLRLLHIQTKTDHFLHPFSELISKVLTPLKNTCEFVDSRDSLFRPKRKTKSNFITIAVGMVVHTR